MSILLALVLAAGPYVPVSCPTGYVATYLGGRVACVNSITNATAATTASTATGLACASTCVQDSEIQSVAASKTTGWPTCSSGQALTSAGTTPACTSTITASDVACATQCVANAEIADVAIDKILYQAHGELYEHHASSTLTLTTQNVYYKWATSTVGTCFGVTCTAAEVDGIAIDRDGVFLVSGHFSGSINAANQIVEMDLFIDTTETEKCAGSVKFTTANDEKSISWTCIVALTRGQVLTLKFDNETSAGKVLTFAHMGLVAVRIK